MVWHGLGNPGQRIVQNALRHYFASFAAPTSIASVDDLTPVIELYHVLMALERFAQAWFLFNEVLKPTLVKQLGHYLDGARLLGPLCEHLRANKRLLEREQRVEALWALAYCHLSAGFYDAALFAWEEIGAEENSLSAENSSVALYYHTGIILCEGLAKLFEAQKNFATHLSNFSRSYQPTIAGRNYMSTVLRYKGEWELSLQSANQGLADADKAKIIDEHVVSCLRSVALVHLDKGEPLKGIESAREAMRIAEDIRNEESIVRSMLVLASIETAVSKPKQGIARAREALVRARQMRSPLCECLTLLALAHIYVINGDDDAATNHLDDIWEPVARGPLRVIEGEALALFAGILTRSDREEEAADYALRAYRIAWSDGPPYAYKKLLDTCTRLLRTLRIKPPADLEEFDDSLHRLTASVPDD